MEMRYLTPAEVNLVADSIDPRLSRPSFCSGPMEASGSGRCSGCDGGVSTCSDAG